MNEIIKIAKRWCINENKNTSWEELNQSDKKYWINKVQTAYNQQSDQMHHDSEHVDEETKLAYFDDMFFGDYPGYPGDFGG